MSTLSKIGSLIASFFLATVLVACGSSTPAETTSSPTTNTPNGVYTKGTIEGDTYTNPLFGIKYTLPKGFRFATEEEVAKSNNATVDMLDDEEYRKALEEGSAFIETHVASTTTTDNINFTIESFDPSLAEQYSTQELTDQVYKNVKDDNTALESIGATDITSTLTTHDFGGTELPVVECHSKYKGTDIYQSYVVFVADNYICNVCFSSGNPDGNATMLDGLSLTS